MSAAFTDRQLVESYLSDELLRVFEAARKAGVYLSVTANPRANGTRIDAITPKGIYYWNAYFSESARPDNDTGKPPEPHMLPIIINPPLEGGL